MKFFQSPQSLFKLLALAELLSFTACKTSHSQLQSDLASELPIGESAWVLVPNIQNMLSPAVLEQTSDPKDPTAPVQVCLYFNRALQATSSKVVEANLFQFWLQAGEFCSDKENPGEKGNLNQFWGAKTLEIKSASDVAWILYLGDLAIGDAVIDSGTGLPIVQSLCSGQTYGKVCRIEATPQSIKIVPGS